MKNKTTGDYRLDVYQKEQKINSNMSILQIQNI